MLNSLPRLMQKSLKLLSLLSIIISIGIITYLLYPKGVNIPINEINSLNGKNDSLIRENNKLLLKIDSLQKQSSKIDSIIVEIEIKYEKDFIDITNQPIAADVLFFTEYLSKNSSRFFNSNNTTTVKAD